MKKDDETMITKTLVLREDLESALPDGQDYDLLVLPDGILQQMGPIDSWKALLVESDRPKQRPLVIIRSGRAK